MNQVSFSRLPALRSVSTGTLVLGTGIVLLAVAAAFVNGRFLSMENLLNILMQASYLSIFTFAQSIPLITRGFDLSLGTVVSATSLVTAVVISSTLGLGVPVAILLGLLAGLLCGSLIGAVNGSLIAFGRLNPFIVTLGVWNIVAGLVAILSGGFPIPIDPAFNRALAQSSFFGVSVPVVAAAVLVLVAWWFLGRTVLGRQLLLMGANPQATKLAGISNTSVLFKAYAICGLLTAVGAVLLTARTGSGEPNLGGALTLQSIAAAVIGGISLRGGEGRFYSPLMGALFITILNSALNFLRVESYLQMVIMGLVIVASVCVDQFRRF